MSEPETIAVREGESGAYPRPFGTYLLLTSLARGGMGEVFLAKSGGIAGIEKHCVVKTLRGNYTMDREYVTRFIDEARVVVQLHHRNICQIYDVGRVGKLYYLAMEYIVGRDLRTIQQRAKELARPFARPLVLHILAEMLEALDYAHRITDPITGEPLSVVHRDVSPQNVMLNFEGEVKLIDFGLAQSAKKVEKTQPHVVMGKMAYMSPEQARGDPVDGRADQFAAAVLCYELLTGERYYEGLSFDQIWSMAGRGGHVPRLWSTLDEPLRDILGRALAPSALARFPTCADFKDELVTYQVKMAQLALSRDTRSFLAELFGDETQAHRDMLARFQNVRMLSRDGDVRNADESQSFSSVGDHESILSGAPVVEEPPRAAPEPRLSVGSKKSKPVSPLRPDEPTVSSLLVSQPSTSVRLGHSPDDRTRVETSPIPELTLVADRPTSSSDVATVFDTKDETDRTSPPTDVRHEPTEAVRTSYRTSPPLAPTVILEMPHDDNEAPKRKSAAPLVIVLGVATVLLATAVVWALRPANDSQTEIATTVAPALSTTTPPPDNESRPNVHSPSFDDDVTEPAPVDALPVDAPPVGAEAVPVGEASPPASVDVDVEQKPAEDPPQPVQVAATARDGDARRKPEPARRTSRKAKPSSKDPAPDAPAVGSAAVEAPPRPKIVKPSRTMVPGDKIKWLAANCSVSKKKCVTSLMSEDFVWVTMTTPEILKVGADVNKCIDECVAWSSEGK